SARLDAPRTMRLRLDGENGLGIATGATLLVYSEAGRRSRRRLLGVPNVAEPHVRGAQLEEVLELGPNARSIAQGRRAAATRLRERSKRQFVVATIRLQLVHPSRARGRLPSGSIGNPGGVRMSMFIGEALAGEGNEVAHIDLLIGSKDGPVGNAFANALADQKAGHSNLLAVLEPKIAVKPSTVMITKVTSKGAKQAVQMFGPAQYAVAKAVADSVAAGVIPKDKCEDYVIVAGVF